MAGVSYVHPLSSAPLIAARFHRVAFVAADYIFIFTLADESRGSKAFIHVCLSVLVCVSVTIEPDAWNYNHQTCRRDSSSPVLATHLILGQKVKVTGSQSAKIYFSWRRSSSRREFALYRVYFVLLFGCVICVIKNSIEVIDNNSWVYAQSHAVNWLQPAMAFILFFDNFLGASNAIASLKLLDTDAWRFLPCVGLCCHRWKLKIRDDYFAFTVSFKLASFTFIYNWHFSAFNP